MPGSPHPDELTFKIHPAKGGSEVPVWQLTQCLTTIQELIQLFALQEEGRTLRQRLRLSEELKSKYVLHCRPPVPGSFAITARVASTTGELFAAEQVGRVVANFQEFSRAAVQNNQPRLLELVNEGRLRNRILSRLITLSPPPGSGYRYELFNGAGSGISLEESLPARIEALLKTPAERAEVQTVTGRLEAISFGEHKLTIIYAPRRRALDCFYDEDIEPMLLENRRDLIQVTGRVIMDDDNHPKRIDEVELIRELDLSPFVLGEVAGSGFRLQPRQSVSLVPQLSENEQWICLEHAPWDLSIFAPTRGELFAELKEHLLMLWEEYGREDAAVLSEPAQRVKQQLVTDLEEVTNAQRQA